MLVAIAVFFVASATRVGWLHVADAMLWGIILLSAVVPWHTVPKLEVARSVHMPRRRSGDVAPVVGDELGIELSVVNNTRIPRYFLSAAQSSFSKGDSETRQKFFFARIPARNQRGSTGTLSCDTMAKSFWKLGCRSACSGVAGESTCRAKCSFIRAGSTWSALASLEQTRETQAHGGAYVVAMRPPVLDDTFTATPFVIFTGRTPLELADHQSNSTMQAPKTPSWSHST